VSGFFENALLKVGLLMPPFRGRLNPAADTRPEAQSGKRSAERAPINKPPNRFRGKCRRTDHRNLWIFQSNQNSLRQPASCDTAESALPLNKEYRDHGNSRRVRVPLPPTCSGIEYTGILRVSWVPPRFRFHLFARSSSSFLPTRQSLSRVGDFRRFKHQN
jgi:hypothetical protein